MVAKREVASRKEKQEENLHQLELNRLEIHARILATQAVSADDAIFCERICRLQDEYNELSEAIRRKNIPLSPLSDPLEALPFEIWTQIILDAVHREEYGPISLSDNLFIFTSVSKSWCDKLTSNALVWADIYLDESMEDYAAKAQIQFYLSKNCLLRISSWLSKSRWLEFRPWLLPHVDRVVELVQHDTNLLIDLPVLPLLRHLYSSLAVPHEAEQVESIDPSCMPLLKTFEAKPSRVSATSPWFQYTLSLSYDLPELSSEETRARHRASNLRHLRIEETQMVQSPQTNSSSLQISTLEHLQYSGPNLSRALTWIGPTLTKLEISCSNSSQLLDIAHAVVNAASLEQLEISATLDVTMETEENTAEPLPFPQTTQTLAFLHFTSQCYSDTMEDLSTKWSRSLHQMLSLAFPRVHNLYIRVDVITLALLTYIEGLNMLRHMDIYYRRVDDVGGVVLRVSSELLSAQWSIVYGSAELFGFPNGTYDSHSLPLRVNFTKNDMIEEEGPAILPLSFDNPSKSTVELLDTKGTNHFLYGIEMLDFPGIAGVFLNDFVESLALCPSKHPILERIYGTAKVIEWDILILMLERRNLSQAQELRRISQFMLDDSTPRHLRHVMERLLAGKYPSRLALSDYSLEAVGRRMFDCERTGCMRCCHLLRDCDSPVIAPAPTQETSTTFHGYGNFYDHFAGDYALPHEYTMANPPLSPYEAAWIARKRERRQNFVQGFKESLAKFCREESCDLPYVYSSRLPMSGF